MGREVDTKTRGISLLELLLALFIFATLVPLFVGLWSYHHRAVKKSSDLQVAQRICRLILEQAMATGYDGVEGLETAAVADRTISQRTTVTDTSMATPSTFSTDREFIWNVNVQTPTENPGLLSGEKLVVVEVEWLEKGETVRTDASTLLVEAP